MIEPGLNTEMKKMRGGKYQHQAVINDYSNSIPKEGVNKGHLFPNSHAHDLDTQVSTFTLTNIVPQVVSFNNGSWREMEENVREKLTRNCISNNLIKAYVVTGAVPSTNNNKQNEKTLKNRVNIPYLMWTAFCCENKYMKNKQWMAGAYWGLNKEGEALNQLTLGALEDKLKHFHGKDQKPPVKVFPEDCSRGPKPTTPPPTQLEEFLP
nr:uncharacterized protein LOC112079617 [Salvelinus alpinus]